MNGCGCTPGAGDDAVLLGWCGEFDRLERDHHRIGEADYRARTEAALHQAGRLADIRAQQAPLIERIVAHAASTLPGHAARAASLHLWAAGELERHGSADGAWDARLIRALVRDLLPCTADQAAAIAFEPIHLDGVMPRAAFIQQAAKTYAVLSVAGPLLALQPFELAAAVTALNPDHPIDVLEAIGGARDWAENLGRVLACVENRCLFAVAAVPAPCG